MPAPLRITAAMFQGGGNIPLLIPVISGLVARGHEVRVLAGPGVRLSRLPVSCGFRDRVQRAGATLAVLSTPMPHPLDLADAVPPYIPWLPTAFRRLPNEARTLAWAPFWAGALDDDLDAHPADLVLADFALPGALAAAEARRIPSVALMHTISIRPMPGVPPYGTGWQPDSHVASKLRNALGRVIVRAVFNRVGLEPMNRARAALRLPPLRDVFAQYDTAARALMLVSRAFDFISAHPPANLRHVGTPIDDAAAAPWTPPWPRGDHHLVLISLSTLSQGQAGVMQRLLRAVALVPQVRAVVTLGPSLDPAAFNAPDNALLLPFLPHSAVLPQADAMVTQGGLGTVAKSLAHGVPLLCIPLVGDQPDNAARIAAHGVGLGASAAASPNQIADALRRLLHETRFRTRAMGHAERIRQEGDPVARAVEEIEAVGVSTQRAG